MLLLRGINVGGRRRVAMADLRSLLAGLGLDGVRTYLQSGNAVVTSALPPAELETAVAAALRQQLDLTVPVLVRTAGELGAVVAANPLPVADPTMFHVGFLAAQPEARLVDGIDRDALLPDRFAIGDRVAYLAYADVSRNTRLSRLSFGVDMTARNWRTVLALQELASG